MNTRLAAPFGAMLRAGLVLVLAAAAPPPRTAPPPAPPDAALAAATTTLDGLHARLGRGYAPLLHNARAVLIAPAGRGPALLLLHNQNGWSVPAFFAAAALHAGRPCVLLVMSDRAVDALLRQDGLAQDDGAAPRLVPVPGGHAAGAEWLVWSPDPHPSLDADGPRQDDDANTAYYGHPRDAAEIVGGAVPELRSSKLRARLGT